VLVGDGPDRVSLEARAAELGIADRVFFTGHMTDVRPVYADIDVMALTSHTEGFSNVVLESLCMHTPVLATDVGGTSEIVQDGRTGVLIPPHQPKAIAAGLRRLLESPDLARALATEGQRVVHRQFEFQARTEQECAIYTELVEARQQVPGR
jgi:glycosyltransferase involved in cell wall biosynthesis